MKPRTISLLLICLTITLTYSQLVGLHPVSAPAPPNQGVAIWTRTENPSPNGDGIVDVAVDSTGIYLVGADQSLGVSNSEWRLQKRSLGDGSAIWTQVENPSTSFDGPTGVAVDSTGLYVVGYDASQGNNQWRIEKRSLTTGALTWTQTENPSTSNDAAEDIVVDSTGLYVVGYDSGPGDAEWRVEKRSLSTGALVLAFDGDGIVQENPSPNPERPFAAALDSSGLYVSGYDESPGAGNSEWMIEKRSLTTGALIGAFGTGGRVQENPSADFDQILSVTVDGTGLYAVGFDEALGSTNDQWRIEKHDLTDGSLLSGFGVSGVVLENPSTDYDEAQGAVVDATGLYVVGFDEALGSSNDQWRIEKRSLSDGSAIWSQTENPSTSLDGTSKVAVDGTGVYVVGFDDSPGNGEWRVEKRNPVLPGVWVISVPLVAGWNLISLPVVPIGTGPTVALATVMAAGNVTIVWSYTGSPTPSWKFFNPKLATGNTLTAIADGMGLWVLMTQASTLYVEGYVIPPAGSPSQYSLVASWNLVGFKPAPDPTASETVGTYLTSLPGSSYDANNVWLYDNPTGVWTRTNSGTSITPGQALWILMLAPAKLAP